MTTPNKQTANDSAVEKAFGPLRHALEAGIAADKIDSSVSLFTQAALGSLDQADGQIDGKIDKEKAIERLEMLKKMYTKNDVFTQGIQQVENILSAQKGSTIATAAVYAQVQDSVKQTLHGLVPYADKDHNGVVTNQEVMDFLIDAHAPRPVQTPVVQQPRGIRALS